MKQGHSNRCSVPIGEGSDGGTCFVVAISSGWDCFGCARADDVG